MKDKDKKPLPDTTVTIGGETALKLDRLAKSTNAPKRLLISLMLDYFERYGIDPTKHEPPLKEMEKVTKRLDQFFAFIKKQEADMIRPMIETVSIIEKRVSRELDILRPIYDAIEKNEQINADIKEKLITGLNTALSNSKKHIDETDKKLDKLVEVVETKLQKKLF